MDKVNAMEETETIPVLISNKTLKAGFEDVQTIRLTCSNFTLGRGLKNSVVIPFLSISRNHCTFKKTDDTEWSVEDNSSLGIKINGEMLGCGSKRKLKHEDIISLEPSEEFVYKFNLPSDDVFETPKKRMKMDTDCDIINDAKIKFEESQQCAIKHIEDKIHNAKQMQTTSMIMKKQLQEDMKRKIQQLENEFSMQIENLKGEKNEVERQKASLIDERDAQLLNVKNEMEGKITELMEQIKKHNEAESELLKENSLLKEKLLKEREDFLSELNRESTSKQGMLDKLEAKIREQEEIRLKERQELEDTLRRETEQLRLAKEKELKELEELKCQREIELQQELCEIKKNLANQVAQTEQQRIKAEQKLKQEQEKMKKLKLQEKTKMERLQVEREEIQKMLTEAQMKAEKSNLEAQARVVKRETELAALAAERIQKQVDQSSEVISTLQAQLEKVTSQLENAETEKNSLLETMCDAGEGTSRQKQSTLNEFGELMESELQCSICAELFVQAMTLNCSHTFCKYCITMWKKKKKDCPICRSPITSECKSLVLDSFIEKMVQNLTDEMKTKREIMLKNRAAEVQSTSRPATTRGRKGSRTTTTRTRTTNTIATTPQTNTTSSITVASTINTAPVIQTVDLISLPVPMNQAERPPLLPAPMHIQISQTAAGHQPVYTTIDLTRIPTQIPFLHNAFQGAPGRQPVNTTIDLTRTPTQNPLLHNTRQERRPGRLVPILVLDEDGEVQYQGFQGPTTGDTDAASLAAPAVTGHPAAPSDNHYRPC